MFRLCSSDLNRRFQQADKTKSGGETYDDIAEELQLENMSIFRLKLKHLVAYKVKALTLVFWKKENEHKLDAHGCPVLVVPAISLIVKMDHSWTIGGTTAPKDAAALLVAHLL